MRKKQRGKNLAFFKKFLPGDVDGKTYILHKKHKIVTKKFFFTKVMRSGKLFFQKNENVFFYIEITSLHYGANTCIFLHNDLKIFCIVLF